MNEYQVRVPSHLVQALLQAVEPTTQRESVAFALVSQARLADRTLLLVKDVIPTPPDAYLPAEGHGARWTGRFTIEVINLALRARSGILLFHKHNLPGPACLSRDDLKSARQLLTVFAVAQPQHAHGSVVLTPDSSTAIIQDGGDVHESDRFGIRLIAGNLRDLSNRRPTTAHQEPLEAFARQALAIGAEGQRRLARSTVAVVGLSGGGSHVVQQLAHLGVGRIVGVDPQTAEESQRSRLVGMAASDHGRPKAQILADLVHRIGLSTFDGVQASVPSEKAIAAIKEADIIVGCLDNLHARLDLQDLAWRFLIPYIDVGLIVDPESRDTVPDFWIAGNLFTLIPGSYCLWCYEYLTEAKLDRETEGRGRSYFKNSSDEAQVVSFNGVLASQAVSETLQLLTGFLDRPGQSIMRKFSGPLGALAPWRWLTPPAPCSRCRESLAAGDAVWIQPVLSDTAM